MSDNNIYNITRYFYNRFWNRIISFLLSIVFVLFVSIITKAQEIPDKENSEDLTIYQPELFEETEELNIGSDFIFEQKGIASWYGKNFNNRKTANGERYNMYSLSAAHRNLPFNSIIRVTNLETNEKILVRINDRGPFVKNKIIDLSYQSMKGINTNGSCEIKLEGLIVDEQNIAYLKSNHCFCYSLNHPLVCLPDSVLNLIDSTRDFDEAYKIFLKKSSDNPDKKIYLNVISHLSSCNSMHSVINEYYISEFISNKENTQDPEITARQIDN